MRPGICVGNLAVSYCNMSVIYLFSRNECYIRQSNGKSYSGAEIESCLIMVTVKEATFSETNIPWEEIGPIAAKLRDAAAAELSCRDISAGLPEYVKRCFSPSSSHEFEIFFTGSGAGDFPVSRYG